MAVVTPEIQNEVAELYIGFFGRAPDAVGFGYWAQDLANGASPYDVAANFARTPEFVSEYAGLTPAQQVDKIYNNVLGRSPDAEGLAYWTGELTAGTPTSVVVYQIVYAAFTGSDVTNPDPVLAAQAVLDQALVQNKVTVGQYFAITLASNNTALAATAFDLVTSEPASVAAAEAYLNANSGETYTLTTGVNNITGTIYDDTFNAGLNDAGAQTLNTQDQLNGNGGIDTLNATITSNVTPLSLQNIEVINVTSNGAGTLGLVNASALLAVTNDGSTTDLSITGLAATADVLNVFDTNNATTFAYISTAGTQTVDLNVDNVGTSGTAAGITLAGIETINLQSGAGTTQANAVGLDANAATAIVIDGAADLTLSLNTAADVTRSVSSIDGSAATGDLDITLIDQTGVLSTTAVTVLGGAGNDVLDVSAETTSSVSVVGGAGNDAFVFGSSLTATDTVVGGDGTDTLSTTYGIASTLSSTNQVNGIDVLDLTDALAGSLTVANVDSTIVELDVAVAGALSTAASTVTGAAGTFTLNLGTSGAGNTGALGAALTITDTGTATTDTAVINNLSVNSTSGANVNVFAGNNITSTGYENVDINTGVASPTAQTIGTLTITADAASAPVDLDVTGQSALSITSLTSNSTGLMSVDASGLSVAASQTGLTISGTTSGALGTQSILGSAGADSITVGNFASTIDGGTGNDALTGGTLADSIHGGAGNDTLTGSGGNDTITGGDGNDSISEIVAGTVSIDGGAGNDSVSMGATLSSSDVVNGGDGTDTLNVSSNLTGTTALGVTNFEILQTTATTADMAAAVNNTGWTTVFADAASVAVSNASSTLNTYQVDATATTTHSFTRLVDTGTSSLTLATTGTVPGATTITTFTANDEESLTIDVSAGSSSVAGSLTLTNLNAADLTSLTLTGDHSVSIANAITGATSLATVNASGITAGTVNVNASNSTVAVTATGASSTANTLVGGTGADSITGGSAADSLTGNNGADTLVGGGGADTLTGGQGADSIIASTGTDSVTAGTGADIVTLSVDGETDTVVQAASASVAATSTNFADATFAAGDTITFGSGVDVVNNFEAGNGGDVLNIGTTFATGLLGGVSSATTIGWLSGTYANGVFTISADGIGSDTLVLMGSTLSGSTTRAVVLAGVDGSELANSNFGGVDTITVIPLLSGTAFSLTAGSYAGERLFISTATGLFTDGDGNDPTYVDPNPASGWVAGTQAALTSVDMSNLLGASGVTVSVAGATSSSLASVTGTTGDDVIIEATEDFGANTSVIDGVSGDDTVRFTTFGTATIYGTVGGGRQYINNIDNIELMAGATSLTMDSTVTNVVAISNESATAAATVVLGTGAAHTYTSASTGIDTVTLGLTGQSATLTNGGVNDVVVGSVAGATVTTDATTLTINGTGNAEADQLAGNYINNGGAASTLVLTAGNTTAAVTTGTITGFETLNIGAIGAATTITAGAGVDGITTLVADTTGAGANATFAMTVAQAADLTTLTNTGGIGTYNLTFSDAGSVNLASTVVTINGTAGDVDVLSFAAAGGNTLTINSANLAKVTGNAVAAGTGDTIVVTDTSIIANTKWNAFENLEAAAGSTAINITDSGVGVARTITGNAGNNVIVLGVATAAKTVDLTDGGTDQVSTSAVTAAGAMSVSGFTEGTGGDVVKLGGAVTTAFTSGSAATTALQIETSNPGGALTFNTAASNVLELSYDFATVGDLSVATNGSALLAGLGGTLSVSAVNNAGYILAYQGSTAYVYYAADTAGGVALDASEIQLVGTLSTQDVGGFVAANIYGA